MCVDGMVIGDGKGGSACTVFVGLGLSCDKVYT